MSIDRRRALAAGAAVFLSALGIVSAESVSAHEYDVGKLKVEHPWLRAPKDGETKARLYMFIHNNGDAPDKLVGVKSDKVGKIEIHADARHDAPSSAITLPAHATVTLAPDGPYVDLLDMKKINPVGWGFELVLVFEKAGEVTIDASIDAPDAKHAHDAEAMARWEKAHGQAGQAPSGHEMHHEHHRMDHRSANHGSADHGAPATSPQSK